ncbi:MAG: PAS domain-containing sensor histidine kinase [Candidatus Heimdallarchaeota archaeon]|nr:PAS domain-containing sensor histidine kinase [Candidatus Heimdallarchaeota archaeon]
MDHQDSPFEADFLDKLPAGIMVLKNRQIVYINKKARVDLGFFDPNNENAGDKLLNFIVPSAREEFQKILMSESPLPEESEWQALLPDGKTTWIQFRVAHLNEEYDIVLIRHIGKFKETLDELDARERQFHDLFSKTPNFLFIFKNGCIDYYNSAFYKLGYTDEEIEERKCLPTFVIAPEHRKKIAKYLVTSKREFIAGRTDETSLDAQYVLPDETSELELLCKDGKRIPVMAIVRRLYIEKNWIIQGVMVDLSPIRQLTELKFDHLTISQHSLRTPISSLRGHLDFFTKKLSEGISIEEKNALEAKFLNVFNREITKLEMITDDLNDIAAIRHGKLKCTLMGEDFIPVLQQAIDNLEFYLKKYRVHITVEWPGQPLVIALDRNRILQALRNIFENAIRFTGHGTVEIVLSVEKGLVNLTCIDSGVGIDPENLPTIGEPFRTYHSSASQLGLGVYLTKQIIEDHNGTLTIESKGFNQGCKVTIQLPLMIAPSKDKGLNTGVPEIDLLIKQGTTSNIFVTRMDAIQQLSKIPLTTEEDFSHVLDALEQIILHDKDQTIRNLASKFYTERKKEFDKKFSGNSGGN